MRKIIDKCKTAIIEAAMWAQTNWLALIILLSGIMIGFLCLVMFSWLYGFWSNALYGTKFELNSCWQGITVVITGLGGVAGLAKAAWAKYSTDSQFNSEAGKMPISIHLPIDNKIQNNTERSVK